MSERFVGYMASDADEDDESFTAPLPEDCIRDAAAEHAVTVDDVTAAVQQLQDALVDEINDLYERAWLRGGPQIHLGDMPEGVFFAIIPHDIRDAFDEDISAELLAAVIDAHTNLAAIWGFDVDRPTQYADKLKSDYRPVYIEYPPSWLDALYHARARMMYLLRHELTPAEALDYWALKAGQGSLSNNQNQEKWRASRGVDHEATYKTIRQAREKMEMSENRPYYEKQDITLAQVDDDSR